MDFTGRDRWASRGLRPGPLTQAAVRCSPPRVPRVGIILGPALDARGGQRPWAAEGQLAGEEAHLGEGGRGHQSSPAPQPVLVKQ